MVVNEIRQRDELKTKTLNKAAKKLGVRTSVPQPDAYQPVRAGRPDRVNPVEVVWDHEPHVLLEAPWLGGEAVAWVYTEENGSYSVDHREVIHARLLNKQRRGLLVLIIFISQDKVIRLADPEQVDIPAHENFIPAAVVQGAAWPTLAEIVGPPVRSSLVLAR
jgi:hypothetical protein